MLKNSFCGSDLFYEQIRRWVKTQTKSAHLKNAHCSPHGCHLCFSPRGIAGISQEKDCHVILCELRKIAYAFSRIRRACPDEPKIFSLHTEQSNLSTAKAIRRAKTLIEGGSAKVTIVAEEERGNLRNYPTASNMP